MFDIYISVRKKPPPQIKTEKAVWLRRPARPEKARDPATACVKIGQ